MEQTIPWATALVLAFVQRATEFIPISSSGHLVVLSRLMGMGELPVAFAVAVHLGTLAAVVVYFLPDLRAMVASLARPEAQIAGAEGETLAARKLWWPLVAATAPLLVVVACKDYVESLFGRPEWVGVCLLLTAAVLWWGDRCAARGGRRALDARSGLCIGLGQAASAMLRGLSRSGTTISVGLACGLSREMAAKFSFLLSIIAILGGGAVKALDLRHTPLAPGQLPIYAVSVMIAAVVGYLSIRWVLDSVRRGRLFRRFGYYCLAAGAATIMASLMGWL